MDDPLVAAYNVADVPTRVLIDATGRIVGRYPGSAFFAFQEDLARLLRPPEEGAALGPASQQSFTKSTAALP
jgi:hypothetical protein